MKTKRKFESCTFSIQVVLSAVIKSKICFINGKVSLKKGYLLFSYLNIYNLYFSHSTDFVINNIISEITTLISIGDKMFCTNSIEKQKEKYFKSW